MKPGYKPRTETFEIRDSEFHATITHTLDGYVVAWNDCAVNGWAETFPTLREAFLLLAAIAGDAHSSSRFGD